MKTSNPISILSHNSVNKTSFRTETAAPSKKLYQKFIIENINTAFLHNGEPAKNSDGVVMFG